MTATLLDLLLRSMLLVAAVWLATSAIRGAGGSAAMRQLAWQTGFAGLALLPVLAFVLPALPVPVMPALADPPGVAAAGQAGAASPVGKVGASSAETSLALFPLIYAGVAAVLLGRLLACRILLARTWRAARGVADA
ncbi:MAG TPA: hypothetical protein VFU80_03665, partial [Sphingomicrobium sp.]|nr:hypothetical protein [Sphingomicrobium sp.]